MPVDTTLQYDPVNAAYPASDEAMRILSQKPQCAWLSVTNGDNIYGSAAVHTILTPVRSKPNLVMLPMSSRNFDSGGIVQRLHVVHCHLDTSWCLARDVFSLYYACARHISPNPNITSTCFHLHL